MALLNTNTSQSDMKVLHHVIGLWAGLRLTLQPLSLLIKLVITCYISQQSTNTTL